MSEIGFREFVAAVLLTYFGWLLYHNPSDETIKGALLMAFAGAWGFYLGGSKVGSDTATKNADTVAAQAQGVTEKMEVTAATINVKPKGKTNEHLQETRQAGEKRREARPEES